jgi:hypothetical protein
MSSLDFDLDAQMIHLEREWSKAYESGIAARADFQSLVSDSQATTHLLDAARERMDRSEALKARIMAKIERLEDKLLSRD